MYEIKIVVKNHNGSIKMWTRRGIEENAATYDSFIADAVRIDVFYKGTQLKDEVAHYERGKLPKWC